VLIAANVFFSNGHLLWNLQEWEILLTQFRLPRALTALFAGGILAVAGLLMQNVFKNPLAGPDVLGISQGASLAVALSLLVGIHVGGLVFMAVIGALAYLLFLLWMSKFLRSPITLLLIGVMGGFMISAFISTLEVFSKAEALKSFVVWSMGSFSKVAPSQLTYFIVLGPLLLILSLRFSKSFDVLLLGAQKASLLGVNSRQVMLYAIIIAGVATGLSTSLCGPIAFVGLVAPHLSKWLLKTHKHKLLIPASFIFGASIAVLADWLSSGLLFGAILPVNATLSILAAPVILYLIIKKSGS